MKSSIDTHMGSIRINDDVIAQYAGTVANECFGIVGMASVNVKEDLVRILKKDNVNRGITVKNEGGKPIENIQTKTEVRMDRRFIKLIITVKKTPDFKKIY